MKLLANRYLQTGVALLLSNFAGAFVGEIMSWFAGLGYNNTFSPVIALNVFREVLGLGLGTLLFSAPCGLFIHMILYSKKQTSLKTYTSWGLMGGLSLKLVFWLFAGMPKFDNFDIWQSTMFGLWACADATVFWLIRRPDKDARPA